MANSHFNVWFTVDRLLLTESGLPLISLLLTVKVSVFSTYTVSTLTSPGHGVRPSAPHSFPLPRSLHSCQHQRTDGVIHHRLVVDGQQLFANTLGNRVKPRAGPSGEYYSFHVKTLFYHALLAALRKSSYKYGPPLGLHNRSYLFFYLIFIEKEVTRCFY